MHKSLYQLMYQPVHQHTNTITLNAPTRHQNWCINSNNTNTYIKCTNQYINQYTTSNNTNTYSNNNTYLHQHWHLLKQQYLLAPTFALTQTTILTCTNTCTYSNTNTYLHHTNWCTGWCTDRFVHLSCINTRIHKITYIKFTNQCNNQYTNQCINNQLQPHKTQPLPYSKSHQTHP